METKQAVIAALPALVPQIVAVDDELIQEMIAFGEGNFPPGDPNLDPAYMRWLCLENPCGRAQAIVIRDDGRLVGQSIMVPADFATGSAVFRGYFVVNVLTHAEYRNRRLFSTIIDAAKAFVSERHEWLLGHPNAAALPGWTRKEMRFRTPLVPYLSGIGFGIGRKIEVVDDEAGLRKIWPSIAEGMIPHGADRVQIVRTLDYMLWRFMRRPDKRYRIGFCRGAGDRPLGFYAVRSWKHQLDLVIDHVSLTTDHAKVRTARPAVVMLPTPPGSKTASHVAALRLPVRKTMPFFATTFVEDDYCFDDVTLAISDF